MMTKKSREFSRVHARNCLAGPNKTTQPTHATVPEATRKDQARPAPEARWRIYFQIFDINFQYFFAISASCDFKNQSGVGKTLRNRPVKSNFRPLGGRSFGPLLTISLRFFCHYLPLLTIILPLSCHY